LVEGDGLLGEVEGAAGVAVCEAGVAGALQETDECCL
jgi:hypothetical protein